MIQEAIRQVVDHKPLTSEIAQEVMREMIGGRATPSQVGAFLTAMRMKRETEDELRGFALAMREAAVRVSAPPDAVDMCGTGGDGANTFNISTVASFVVAGAGVPVAKHGNRSVSSRCGSADVLGALGIPFDLPPSLVQKCLDTCGMGFMFAPVFHQSMKNVVGPRREVGLRTFFNILGPMTNPADVKNQLIGVYDMSLAGMMARVLRGLGTERAMIVNGMGMDEITNTGKSQVVDLRDGEVTEYEIEPAMFDMDLAEPEEIRGGDATENARIALSILKGEHSARADIVALNAAAGFYVSGKVSSLQDGLEMASESLRGGHALQKARQFADLSWQLEAQRQRQVGVDSLRRTRLHPDTLRLRAGDMTRSLLSEISGFGMGQEMLEGLDKELIANPNVLTVLVLRRILSVLGNGDGIPAEAARSEVGFLKAIDSSRGIAVIAEYKPRSPSTPPLVVPPDLTRAARAFSSGGVDAVSVLVEPDFFSGSGELFASMRSMVRLPMLFKDFVVSERQIENASRLGADAILLIAKAIRSESLDMLVDASLKHHLEPVVEVHDETDLDKLTGCSSYDNVRVVGMNSRDLRTLRTDLKSIVALRDKIRDGKRVIAESGLRAPSDISVVAAFDAVLVGSAFMQAEDVEEKVRDIVTACRGETT